jgi:DNA-binding NarL/FixJ family response regulator
VISTVIADDSDDIRLLIRIQLSIDGRFDVVGEAADGQQALDLIDANDPDLLLLDLAMPTMDGLEVLACLQGRESRPPVVVFSGFASQTMIDRALELGAAAYIDKGRDLSDIAAILVEAVEQRSGSARSSAR